MLPPAPELNADGFIARYNKVTHFDAGSYYFYADSDDGARIYLDGAIIMDGWLNSGGDTTVDVSEGNHLITVEYYENDGTAHITFGYNLSSTPSENIPDNVYESADAEVTPDSPGVEADTDNVIAHDGAYLTTASSNQEDGYDSQVYKFSPDTDGLTTPQFNVSWIGHGATSEDKSVSLSIWNFLNEAWDTITTNHCGEDCTLSGHLSGTKYKGEDGTSWIWAKADSAYGPPVISNVSGNGGLLPISWDTDVDATSMIAYDTESHNNWDDYSYHLSDQALVTSHTISPELSSGYSQEWTSFATSSDGSSAVATTYCGDVWQTVDGGATWAQNDALGYGCWGSAAMSSDGSIIAVGAKYNGYIYISTDGGESWTTHSNSSGLGSWFSIAMSSDGQKIIAADDANGYIHTSSDSGVTWTTNGNSSGSRIWTSVDSDPTGTKLVATDNQNGYIYTSSDSGATWTTNGNSSGIGYWRAVSMTSDGTKIIASKGNNEYLQMSTNGGATWDSVVSLGRGNWSTASMSADGNTIVVGGDCGDFETSADGGTSWVNHSAMNGCWWGTTVSDQGEKIYAGQDLGDIWSSSDQGNNFENQTGQVWYYRVRSAKEDGAYAISDEYSLRFQTTSSCPFIFTNDGNKYNFVIDASSSGTMGQGLDKDLWAQNPFFKTPSYPNPESFVKIPHGKLVPITDESGTYYDIRTTFELNEVNYYDQAALEVIDHSPNVDVFPDHRNNKQVHTVLKNAPAPIWVKDASGNDVTALIAQNDDVYWHSSKLDDPSYLTIKLTNGATTPANIKLVIKKAKEGLFQGNKQSDSFQYKNASGVFVNVPSNLNPYVGKRTGSNTTNRILTNNYGTDTKVVDLSGLTIKDNEIRFVVTNRQLQSDIDWIAVDTSPDESVTVTKLAPSYADLHSRGVSEKVPTNPGDPKMKRLLQPDYYQVVKTIGMGNPLSGNATKYGDVKDLLASVDDKYVILVQGDEISLRYDVPPQADGTERDFIYDTWDYHKSAHNALGDTIGPLPFNAMSNYPYHEDIEHYPTDADHQSYQDTYNTRVINWGTSQTPQDHHSLNTDMITLTTTEASSAPVLTEVSQIPSKVTANNAIYHFISDQECDALAEQVQASKHDGVEVVIDSIVPNEDLTLRIVGVKNGGTYSVRFRCINTTNSQSNILQVGPFTIVGASPTGGISTGGGTVAQVQQSVSTPTVQTATNSPNENNTTCPITTTLKFGSKGAQVKCLQQYLNTHGFIVSPTGPGSIGKETTLFSVKTKAAVIKFQLAHNLKGDGVVGPLTRAKLN